VNLDLIIALMVMLAMSIAIFIVTLHLTRRMSRLGATLVAAGAVAFLVLHATVLLDHVAIARWLPLASLVVLGNFSPPATAVLAGAAWRALPGTALRRGALLIVLATICLWRAYAPLVARVSSPLNDRWTRGVCRQTSSSTCSPAAAATLLHACGIDTTEREMAELCLTGNAGTSMHGLYRGLKLKTAGTDWDVVPITCPATELRDLPGPMMLTVGLPPGSDGYVDPRFTGQWGWAPGVRHTVVLFGFTNRGQADIGDPNVGRERWDMNGLSTLYRGQGFRLVRRSTSPRRDAAAARDVRGDAGVAVVTHVAAAGEADAQRLFSVNHHVAAAAEPGLAALGDQARRIDVSGSGKADGDALGTAFDRDVARTRQPDVER
jgi:hypothetical protein